VTKLHGGFSGSLVLKTDSYGQDDRRDEPTVTKLDDAVSMLEEVNKTTEFTKLVGASAAKVQRGPYLVDASGDPIEEGATEKDFGCVVLDMAGACWVMPEFFEKFNTELISTFKQHVVRQLAAQPSLEISIDVMAVMQELWGAGGPLRALSIETCKRSVTLATQPGGLIEGALRGIITSLILAFRAPKHPESQATYLAQGYEAPLLLDGCISKALESKPGWLKEDWFSTIDGLQAKKFEHSLVHDCNAAVWRDEEDTCKALVDLVEELESLLQPGDSTWLANYKPLRMHQHGDLNCGNILVDVRNSLWLIDFAKAGEQALFVDAAKMVSVILFEQFPVPLTLEDLRRRGGAQKLVDALGASKDEADYVANLATACDSKAALVKRLAADGSHQRFLPFIDDDAVAEQRAKEACGVIDLLFKPNTDGQHSQLWEMGERQPPAEWPAYAQLALQLCARVLKVTTELVVECSRREQGNGEAVNEDLHPIHFLLPLLKRALSTLRYRDCGSWQKRVAWHATQQLAEALSEQLRQAPQKVPASAYRVLATELRLVAGQPIAMFFTLAPEIELCKLISKQLGHPAVRLRVATDADGCVALSIALAQINACNGPWPHKLEPREYTEEDVRQVVAVDDKRRFELSVNGVTNETNICQRRLGSVGWDGGMGQRRLFLASADKEPSAQHLTSDDTHALMFDQFDQTVLPWQVTSPETVGVILEAAQQSLVATVPALLALVQTVPSREMLSNERDQGADSKAVSDLIERLQQITPNSTALRDRKVKVKELIISACDEKRTVLNDDLKLWRALQRALTFEKLDLQATVEAWSIDQLTNLGGLSIRSYAVSQRLLVHKNGAWHEQAVTHSAHGSTQHQLEGSGGQLSIALHPWNHAPLVLPLASFESLRSRHGSTLCSEHASIVDALSGQRLDIFDQCVPIKVVATAEQASPSLAEVSEVEGLALWLLAAHVARRDAADAGPAACLLLTAPPAAGKTCLMSQLVMHVLKSKECDMVPILIKVQELQRHLLNESNRTIFERSWNWVDAFLQCVHGATSDQYRMLRQALMARRSLVLLDGIDEGGKARDAIERHVTEVLAPQGHVMLVTSRPAGLDEERFRHHFEHMQLEPLSEAQQEDVIARRLGKGEHSDLLAYLRNPNRVPLDHETQQRVTGNPLMLSMVISIFQSKKGTESAMPATITELYETASKAILERVDRKERGAAASAAAVPHLTMLLEATFFEAHAAEVRDFGDEQLNRAALALFVPDKLQEQHPGLNLDVACATLPAEAKAALRAVRERVARDRLPLLSLLEAEPLRMRSSHLSFQEYFTVRAICTGNHRLPRDSPPWKWGPFWANVTKLGGENGTTFGDGLLRAADVEGDELNLSGQLGGDRPTVLAVVCALMGSLRVLDLSSNGLGPEGGVAVAEALRINRSLTTLVLQGNKLGPESGVALAEAVKINGSLTSLDLTANDLGDVLHDVPVVCALMGSLRVLDLSSNKLGPEGGVALAEALKVSGSLTSLFLYNNNIGAEGASAIAEALKVNRSLNVLDLTGNLICDTGAVAISEVFNISLTNLDVKYNGIGSKGSAAIAEALKLTGSLSSLNVKYNSLGEGSKSKLWHAAQVRSGFDLTL